MGWVLCVQNWHVFLLRPWQRGFSKDTDTDFGLLYCVHPQKGIRVLQGSGLYLENHCPKGSEYLAASLSPGSVSTLGEQSVSSIH